MLKKTQQSVQASFGERSIQVFDKTVGSASKSMSALASMTSKFSSAIQSTSLPKVGGDVSKLVGLIDKSVFSVKNAGASFVTFQSKIAGVGAEARNLSGAFSGVQRGAEFVTGSVRNMIAPITASVETVRNIGLSLNEGSRAFTGFASSASSFTSAAQTMNIPQLGGDVAKLTKLIDNSAQALIKKSVAADKVGKSLASVGSAASGALGPLASFVSFITRIAVFSVAAGLVVRGFFAISQALSDAVRTGLNFNKLLEQGKLSIAALLVSGRDLANTMGATVELTTAYQLQLSRASTLQQELLTRSIVTLGTYQELADVFQMTLAFTNNQVATDQERLTLSQGILNAGKLLGLSASLLSVETRQILTLESQRGQQILNALGVTVQQLREYKKQGTLVQKLNELLLTYNIISGKIGLTWEGLTSTVKTFFSFLAGRSFEQTFEAMRQILIGMVEEFKELNKQADFTGVIGLDNEELKELGASFARVAAATTQWLADFINGLLVILDKLRFLKVILDDLKVILDDLMAASAGAGGLFGGTTAPPLDERVFDSFDELSERVKGLGGLLDNLKKDFDSLNENQLNATARGMALLSESFSNAERDIRLFAREHPEAATSAEVLLSTLNRMRGELDAETASLEKAKKGLGDIDKAAAKAAKDMDKARQSLVKQTPALLIENEELAKAAAGFITLETALLNAEERQNALKSGSEAAARAFRKAKEANDKYRESIEAQIKAQDELQQFLGDQSDFLNDTKQKLEDNIKVMEEQNRIVLDAIATGRNWKKVQVDLEVATERFRIAQEALAKGIPISTQALQDMAEQSVRLQHELDKNKEKAEAMSKNFLFSFAEIQDVFDEVVRGIARGTSDLSDIFIRQGQALGASLITGILVGKSKLEGGIGKNFNQLFGLGPGGILGTFAQGGSNAASAFFGTFLPDFQGIFGSLSAIGSNLFGGTAGFTSNLGSLLGSIGLVGGAALGFGIAAGLKSVFGVGGTFEGGIASMILGTGGALGGAAIGATFGATGGPIGAAIGAILGSVLGGVFGDMFANLPTKGTQIRQGVVKWLEDIDVSFADQVKSGNYFFKTTKALADELGIGFLEASKIVLETEAGPEIAKQLQALGAFITAEAAEELGKPLEQTATTFGNMLVANLGIEAIPEAMAEIIDKAGITFEAVIKSLNKVFEEGRISVKFYNDTIQGAVDLFLTDLPAALDVAVIAMRSFTEDGIFSLEIFEEKLEQAVENFTTIGEAAAQALTRGIEEGLSASEVGDIFEEILKAALREAAIAEFVEKFFEDLFKDIDLTKPFELSSAAMAELRDRVEEGSEALKEFLGALGLLPEVTEDWLGMLKEAIAASDKLSSIHKEILLNDEEFLAQGAQGLQVINEALDGIEKTIGGFGQSIASTIIDAMLAGFTIDEATFVALVQGMVARAVLEGIIAGIIQSFVIQPIIEQIFAPIKAQVLEGLAAGLPFGIALAEALAIGAEAIAQIPDLIAEGIAIVVDFLGSPEMQELLDFVAAMPTFTAPEIPIDEPVEELAITVEDLADAVDDFVASVEGSEDPFQQLIDDYKELLALFEDFETQEGVSAVEGFEDLAAALEALEIAFATIPTDVLASAPGLVAAIGPLFEQIDAILADIEAGIPPSVAELETLLATIQQIATVVASVPGLESLAVALSVAGQALVDAIANYDDIAGEAADTTELLAEAHAAFIEGLENEIDEINTTTSIFDDLTETLEEVRDAQEGIRQAFDEGLITLEEFTLLIKELAQATLVELVSELRALTDEIADMAKEIQDTIGDVQDFIDAGEELSDLESDLADLTDEREQALKDLRKEMLGVILSGESMGQMLEDINESFENQAQAIGDALIEDLTDPINDFLKSIEVGGSTISGFNSDFAAMMSDFDEAIAAGDFEAVGEVVNDMVELAEQVHNLIEAFDDLVDGIDDSIQDLIEGGMTLEERANAIGSRIAEGFATIGSLSFEDQLEKAADIQADLIEQFNVLEELERSRLDDAIAVQEAIKEARQEEIQSTINSLDERIQAHEDAQREIEQVEEEISRIQIDIRKRDLQAALDVIDERIRLQEQANKDLLSAQEQAAADLLDLQEQTNEELIRMAEDFRSAAESIREAIDDILLSDVSPLTPVQRLQEAQRQFQNLVTAARGGDVGAARELGGVAQQLLAEASSFFASSAPFQAIFGETIKTLDELGIQFDQRALLSEQEIVERAVKDVEEAILLTGQDSVEELREARRAIEQELLGLDDTLENQLAEAQGRLEELNSTLENNVDELIITRDALVQELGDLDEAFNRDVDELTKAFDVLISGHRKDTVDQLLALKGIAETSRDSLQDIETDVVAGLTDIADNVIPTAVNDIVNTFLLPVNAIAFNTNDTGPIVTAINKPLWVDSVVTALNNIASKVGASSVSLSSPPSGGGGFVPPSSGPRVLTWPGFGASPPSPSLLSQFDFVQFALPGGGFSNLVKAQHGGIFTRPTMGLLGEAGPEAVIPLRRSESVFDIDYDRLGQVVAEALSGNNNSPSQNNINIEVKTDDGETITRRTIRTMSDESRSGKILIDGRAVSRRGRFRRA